MALATAGTSVSLSTGMARLAIRDVSLFVEVIGSGYPLLLMHGGPGADHWTLAPFRGLADTYSLVFYDHRCNGRSEGAPVSTMTWDNLTADADALRETLGYDRWAVLGHSFGGMVALEYTLRYPNRVSHLVLLDTGGDAVWPQQKAAELAERRGASPEKVELVRRWFNGEIAQREMFPILMRIGDLYAHHPSLLRTARDLLRGEWRTRLRPEALIFAGRHLLPGWTVMDRLPEITAPTLVVAGRDDFIFPPEHQREVAARIPGARLHLIDRAGHNPHSEQEGEVLAAVRAFAGTARPFPIPNGRAHDVEWR